MRAKVSSIVRLSMHGALPRPFRAPPYGWRAREERPRSSRTRPITTETCRSFCRRQKPDRLLAIAPGEVRHELRQGLDPFGLDRVVERYADAAHAAMSLEAHHAIGSRLVDEFLLELLARKSEHDVHHRAARAIHRSPVKPG